MSKIKILLIILLTINIIYVTGGILFHPIQSMDTVGIWMLKAKAIYLENNLPLDFLKSVNYSYSHQQYPLLVPFLYSLIFKLSGSVNELPALLMSPVVYLAILIICFKVFSKTNSSGLALIFVYFYSMFSALIGQAGRGHGGNADIFLVFMGWLLLNQIINFKENKSLVLICIIIAVASQIKNEGIFLITLLLFLKTSRKNKLFALASSLSPFLFWQMIIFRYKIPTDISITWLPLAEIVHNFVILLFGFLKEMVNFKNWYIFWPMFFLSLFLPGKLNETTKRIILPALILQIFLYFIVFIFSDIPITIFTTSALDRVLLQMSPFYFYIFFGKVRQWSVWKYKIKH